jgi:RimJ/RimL family protein N-acetyltransferase
MFNGMKINRIFAYIHRDNIASQRMAEKCGLKREATLRGIWYQHGKYQDLDLYRVLREEFLEDGSF